MIAKCSIGEVHITLLCTQAVAEQIAQERDAAEREAREKETRVLSLTREIDEMNDKVEELERGRRQLQAELDELVNNQGTADKNVSRFIGNCDFQTCTGKVHTAVYTIQHKP